MDKPPIVDELLKTIEYLESLMKDRREHIDPRWFQFYVPEEKPKLKIVGEGNEHD